MSAGPDASERAAAVRAELAAIAAEPGHAVEVARRFAERLDRALADGSLRATSPLTTMRSDLDVALATDDRGKVGGKSAEAARFILRAILRNIGER